MEEMNVQHEQMDNVHQTPEVTEAPAPQMASPDEDQSPQRNFARLREAKERAEYERDEAIRYIQRMQTQHTEQHPASDEKDPAPDDLTERWYVDKKIKSLENQIRQYEQHTQSNVAEARIRSQYNDFDQVVTPETIELLRNTYPEVAQTLHATPDLYSKAVSTYNIIKKFGISRSSNPQAEYEKQLAQRNASKPRSANSVSPQQGETPLNKANEWANGILTPERKAQLYKEMIDAKNNY